MKIEITFRAEPDDTDEYRQLDGKILRMDGARNFSLSTPVDTFPDGSGGKLPGPTGSLSLHAHGHRAMWAEGGTGEPALRRQIAQELLDADRAYVDDDAGMAHDNLLGLLDKMARGEPGV